MKVVWGRNLQPAASAYTRWYGTCYAAAGQKVELVGDKRELTIGEGLLSDAAGKKLPCLGSTLAGTRGYPSHLTFKWHGNQYVTTAEKVSHLPS